MVIHNWCALHPFALSVVDETGSLLRAQSHDQQLAQKRHDEAVAAAELAAYVANIRFEDAKAAAAGAARAAVAKQRAVDLAFVPTFAKPMPAAKYVMLWCCGAVVL